MRIKPFVLVIVLFSIFMGCTQDETDNQNFKGYVFRINLSSKPENLDQLYNVLCITIGHCCRQSATLPLNQETETSK